MEAAIVYVDGRRVSPDDPWVRVTDRGYLLGDGVFATLRARRGRCFRASLHLDGLARGLALFELEAPDRDVLAASLDEAARATGLHDAYVRVTVARAHAGSRVSIHARALDVPTEAEKRHGVSAAVVATRRAPPECMDPRVKTTSYAGSLLAMREAERRGHAQALQRAVDGTLACAAMANLFVVHGRVLTTPPVETGCRAGVTRAIVCSAAEAHDLVVEERRIDDAMLACADEVFVTSTRVGCLGLASVEGLRTSGKLEITRALDAALERILEEETAR